jgi:hypothetical protein
MPGEGRGMIELERVNKSFGHLHVLLDSGTIFIEGTPVYRFTQDGRHNDNSRSRSW